MRTFFLGGGLGRKVANVWFFFLKLKFFARPYHGKFLQCGLVAGEVSLPLLHVQWGQDWEKEQGQ